MGVLGERPAEGEVRPRPWDNPPRMSERRLLLLPVLVLALGAPALPAEEPPKDPPGFWTEKELALLDRGLEALNCTRADLGFQKRPIEDPFRLEVVNRALDDPLSLGAEAKEWDDVARAGNAEGLLARTATTLVFPVEPTPPDSGTGPYRFPTDRLPEGARDPFVELMFAIDCKTDFRDFNAPGEVGAHELALLRKALLSQVEKPCVSLDVPDVPDAEFLSSMKDRRYRWTVATSR